MSEWTKVVSHPLGLAGFALFLVFLVLVKILKSKEPGKPNRLITTVFLTMAVFALVAGFGLAYLQLNGPETETTSQPSSAGPGPEEVPEAPVESNIEQTTKGSQSPAVAVTITYGATEPQKSGEKAK